MVLTLTYLRPVEKKNYGKIIRNYKNNKQEFDNDPYKTSDPTVCSAS